MEHRSHLQKTWIKAAILSALIYILICIGIIYLKHFSSEDATEQEKAEKLFLSKMTSVNAAGIEMAAGAYYEDGNLIRVYIPGNFHIGIGTERLGCEFQHSGDVMMFVEMPSSRNVDGGMSVFSISETEEISKKLCSVLEVAGNSYIAEAVASEKWEERPAFNYD